MILNGCEGKPIPVYGTGENVRDWLHVEDHVRALLAVFEHGMIGDYYNIGGPQRDAQYRSGRASVRCARQASVRPDAAAQGTHPFCQRQAGVTISATQLTRRRSNEILAGCR